MQDHRQHRVRGARHGALELQVERRSGHPLAGLAAEHPLPRG
jgi:hypothetical protein